MTNIFVGNLSYQTTEEELRSAFAEFGAVERVSIVRDRDSGQPRGFAFVEMTDPGEAEAAMASVNGRDIRGRKVNVNEARPREPRAGGGGGGFAGGRGGRSGGGGGYDRGGGGNRW